MQRQEVVCVILKEAKVLRINYKGATLLLGYQLKFWKNLNVPVKF